MKTSSRVSSHKAAPVDLVTAYAKSVVAGQIVAGHAVWLACERHLRDLKRQRHEGFPYRWHPERAQEIVDFFHDELQLDDGKPFDLNDWQVFILGSLNGWRDLDGHRRFRTAYNETGKGSGKTPMAAGLGLFGLVADKEPSAEIYSCGVTRDQAAYLFRYAKKMAEESAELSELLGDGIGEHNIAWAARHAFFRPLSSEGRGLDNKRPHMALIDEVHEHPHAVVVDKMRAGTKGRRDALIFLITNSGYDRNSVCWRLHEYSLKVLEGAVSNETWFAYVCQLDDGDDWQTEGPHWLKANPNLGKSLTWQYLREQVEEAKGMPDKQNIVRRLNFCEWTEQATRWLDLEKWRACGEAVVDEESLVGRPCYAGLDLAATTDIAALVLLFPDEDGGFDVVSRFWIPEDGAAKRAQRDRVPYPEWIEQGKIAATAGNVTDYDVIREQIRELAERYDIRAIAYDRWGATQLVTQLMGDGADCVPVGQGFASMSAPSKELEKLILGGALRHGNNPVLNWMARNVAVELDAAGNIKPSKAKSTERIDGIVAMVMALSRAMCETADDAELSPDDAVVTWLD